MTKEKMVLSEVEVADELLSSISDKIPQESIQEESESQVDVGVIKSMQKQIRQLNSLVMPGNEMIRQPIKLIPKLKLKKFTTEKKHDWQSTLRSSTS